MAEPQRLGELQHLIMLSVARLGERAFGSAIQEELGRVAGRELSVSAIYVTLVRLEDQGMVESYRLEPDHTRGGRRKRIFELTPEGWQAIQRAKQALLNMWEGVSPA